MLETVCVNQMKVFIFYSHSANYHGYVWNAEENMISTEIFSFDLC